MQGADLVFGKCYRGEVLVTVIYYGYGGGGKYYVCLTPAGNEEQALVDTLFPSIYGQHRGKTLVDSYPETHHATDISVDVDARILRAVSGSGRPDKSSESKDADVDQSRRFGLHVTRTAAKEARTISTGDLFARLSVWEASEPVPDPDEEDADDLGNGSESSSLDGGDYQEGDAMAVDLIAAADTGPTVDASGGSGYVQVYMVMQPTAGRDQSEASALTARLRSDPMSVPRQCVFRFGSWVYCGDGYFPVSELKLGDVPFVLPALQKQQGRLGYLCDVAQMPAAHPMTATLSSFMAAVQLFRDEMVDSQEEVAALAETGLNAWIDEEWAASFFELSFVPETVPESLKQAEVIACKIYLYGSSGVVLHVVWIGSSMYCVLADSLEDLPLLDVAFPDVTARNRVVQVKSYPNVSARKLADAHSAKVGVCDTKCPHPRDLRVWEGRRRGVVGVGFGAVDALRSGDQGKASDIAERARARAAADAQKQTAVTRTPASATATGAAAGVGAAATVGAANATASTTAAPDKAAASEGKDDFGDDLYDMGNLKTTLGIKSPSKAAASSAAAESKYSEDTDGAAGKGSTFSLPSNLMNSVARAPHFVAPLGSAASTTSSGVGSASNRLVTALRDNDYGSEFAQAPWDASGKPVEKKKA
jgi:hypothetical protein